MRRMLLVPLAASLLLFATLDAAETEVDKERAAIENVVEKAGIEGIHTDSRTAGRSWGRFFNATCSGTASNETPL